MALLKKLAEMKDQATSAFKTAQEDGTIDALKAAGKAKVQEVKAAAKKLGK